MNDCLESFACLLTSWLHTQPRQMQRRKAKKRIVTGISGIFFLSAKRKDPEGLKEWYRRRPGLNTDSTGRTLNG